MKIQKAIIKNYKIFKNFEISFNKDVNIIIGNNETGKTTLLEALHLALTCQINNRNLKYELSPYFFNQETVNEYLSNLQRTPKTPLPEIKIEIFFHESDQLKDTIFYGRNNSPLEDAYGVSLTISFDPEFQKAYAEYISEPAKVKNIPVEYYEVKWYTFSNAPFKFTQLPFRSLFLTNVESKYLNAADRHISDILDTYLLDKENASLALMYRKLKESFGDEESIKKINEKLIAAGSSITDKKLALSVDISTKNTWETNLTLYLNNIPFKYIGKGEQNAIKTKLAIQNNVGKASIVMIEEPETSLSFGNMHKLLENIEVSCADKQIFITTHSSFIMNKIGVEKTIFIHNNIALSMSDIGEKTQKYFKKLPGYDTLRMVLSKKCILVEGPSDELIVQRAYLDKNGKLPIQDGIDVLSVSLGFKRFLEIAKKLQKPTVVVTDNDGDIAALATKYADYSRDPNIKICCSMAPNLNTLEPNLVASNELACLNTVLGQSFPDKESLSDYMSKHKTACALAIFESSTKITMPQYILDAIA